MLGQTKPGMKKEHLYSVNTEKKNNTSQGWISHGKRR